VQFVALPRVMKPSLSAFDMQKYIFRYLLYIQHSCLFVLHNFLIVAAVLPLLPQKVKGKQLAAIMANARTICTLGGVGISTCELRYGRCTATMRQRKYLSATQSTSCFCFANTRSDEAPSTTLSSWICNASTCWQTHWVQPIGVYWVVRQEKPEGN